MRDRRLDGVLQTVDSLLPGRIRNLPQRGSNAYSRGELKQLNKVRQSKQPFEPY